MTEPLNKLPDGFDPFDLEPIVQPHSALVSEFFASTVSLKQAEIDYLMACGVPPLALCHDPGEDGWLVGRAHVRIDDGGLFDFVADGDEAAVKALCLVARDVSGYPIDIVAWVPKEDRVASHYGRVVVLGEQHVEAVHLEPMKVHKSALDWLRAGRTGIVILNERRAWRVLEGIPVVAQDLEHGIGLGKILTAPPPRVLVPEAV